MKKANYVIFKDLLTENISNYDGKLSKIIMHAPNIYGLLCNLLSSEKLTRKDRNRISSVIGYLILPTDVYPGEVFGIEGYLDDIYLCLHTLKELEKKITIQELISNWEGEENSLKELLGANYDYLDKHFNHTLKDMHYYIGLN